MNDKHRKITVCNRCGQTYVTEMTKDESLPHGWKQHSEVGLLCAACNRRYTDLIERFMRGY